MAAKRSKARQSRGRVVAETVALYRDPATKLLLQVKPDQGTAERAAKQGGVTVGFRDVAHGGSFSTKGAWANATGIFEAMDCAGLLAPKPTLNYSASLAEDKRRSRLDAGHNLRDLAVRAGLQKTTTGLYGVRVGGKREESDAMAAARSLLGVRGEKLGWWRMYLLLDILVLEQIPPEHKIPSILAALDSYAALLDMAAKRGQ